MDQEEKEEFCRWYHKNEHHFRDYSLYEICMVAIACGFKDIYKDIDQWIKKSKARERLWNSPFHEKWIRAWCAQRGHDDV